MTQFDSIFAALQGTRYVVVGGVAVNLHGYIHKLQTLKQLLAAEKESRS